MNAFGPLRKTGPINGAFLRRIPLLIALAAAICLVLDALGNFINPVTAPLLDDLYPLVCGWFFFCIVIMFLIGLIGGVLSRRKLSLHWAAGFLLASVFAMASPYSYGSINSDLGDWRFRQHLDEYTSVVTNIKNGEIPIGEAITDLDLQKIGPHPDYVISVRAAKKDDGIVVEFLTGSAGRVHRGYLFKQNENSLPAATRPTSFAQRLVTGDWYEFST